MLCYFVYAAMNYFLAFVFVFTLGTGHARAQTDKGKKLALTAGVMFRSGELLGDVRYTGFGVPDLYKLGANAGIRYALQPKLKADYHINIRHGAVNFNEEADALVKEFITDHTVMLLYTLSNAAVISRGVGVGISVVNAGKGYTKHIPSANRDVYHKLQHLTFDLIGSFSFRQFYLEPKLMFNYSDGFYGPQPEKQVRMMVSLRLYYAFNLL